MSACVENSKWVRLTLYDEEAIEMMTQLTFKQEPAEDIHTTDTMTDS